MTKLLFRPRTVQYPRLDHDIPRVLQSAPSIECRYNRDGIARERTDNIDDRQQEIQQSAERFADSMGQQFGIEFDFSVESLRRLDGWLTEWIDLAEVYAGDQRENMLPVAFGVATYAGEVMRRNLENVVWVTEQDDSQIPTPHLLVDGRIRVNLMKKAVQVLSRADTPSFFDYFQTIVNVAGQE